MSNEIVQDSSLEELVNSILMENRISHENLITETNETNDDLITINEYNDKSLDIIASYNENGNKDIEELNPHDDDGFNEDITVVQGGMNIYLQGGRIGRLISGGNTQFIMNDLDINLSLGDSESQIKYSFKLNDLNELNEWLNSNDIDFLAKCLRKFKFHFVYSNALKGLFFDIVQLFEKYILTIVSFMYKNDTNKIQALQDKWEVFDKTNNIESSSIILYQFGKDTELNKFIKSLDNDLFLYISNKDNWSYLGWCPYVPDIRYKALLGFPLEMVVNFINKNAVLLQQSTSSNIDFKKLGEEFSQIQKINTPVIKESYNEKYTGNDLKSQSEALHKRIKLIEPQLREWEEYYVKSAAQIMEIAKIWQNNFKEFGKQ